MYGLVKNTMYSNILHINWYINFTLTPVWWIVLHFVLKFHPVPVQYVNYLLADLKNQPIVSLSITHILQFCSYFKGQEQFGFNPTSWHLVTYNFL